MQPVATPPRSPATPPPAPPAPPAPTAAETAGLVALAAAAAALLSWVGWLWPLAYPFRLLLTLVHELSHGLAALATGGRFLRFVVFADGSGLAYTAGGWRFLVIPAGYLGAAAFGAALILVARSRRGARGALALIGAAVALLTLRYGVPTLFTAQVAAGALTTVSGLLLGAGLVWLAVSAAAGGVVFAVYLLAIEAGLTAFVDLWTLIGLSAGAGGGATDARSMAELTGVPALVWAVVWAVAAALLLGAALRAAWRGAGKKAAGIGPGGVTRAAPGESADR